MNLLFVVVAVIVLDWIDSYVSARIVSGGWGRTLSWAIRQLSRLIWKTWPTLYSQLTLLKISLLNSCKLHTRPLGSGGGSGGGGDGTTTAAALLCCWMLCCLCFPHSFMWLFLLLHWLYRSQYIYINTQQPERRLCLLCGCCHTSHTPKKKKRKKLHFFSDYLFRILFLCIFFFIFFLLWQRRRRWICIFLFVLGRSVHFVDIDWYCI